MRKNKKINDPNILVEKQKFYISEFDQEATWLSFMHREGWKFSSTDGYRYKFEKAEKEDWCYQLDYKENGIAEEDYIHKVHYEKPYVRCLGGSKKHRKRFIIVFYGDTDDVMRGLINSVKSS